MRAIAGSILAATLTLVASAASAGAVADLYRGGAFGLPWSASPAAIEAKYPGGKWSNDEAGRRMYCAASRQPLLKLPHQTRELCFIIGTDGTLAAAAARMEPSLPALLAVVNRSRTNFGDFDAVKRDQNAIQSASTAMLWTKDRPYIVQVKSINDTDGAPKEVTFAVADEQNLYSEGAASVSHRPTTASR
jgi:hypothetical protein